MESHQDLVGQKEVMAEVQTGWLPTAMTGGQLYKHNGNK